MKPIIINLSNVEEEDFYSPTDWERESGESDEDYNDRVQDLEDYIDSFND